MRRSRPALREGLGSSSKSCPSPFCNGARVCDSEGPAEHPRAQEAEKEARLAERVGLYPTQLVVGTRWDAFFRYRNLLHPKDLF
jgi:hypothetical protein